jgi:DNA-binding CsgD family transcriptional regulator/PAS domain-containing protein
MEQEPESGRAREVATLGFTDATMRSYEDYYAYRSVLLKESAKYKRVGRIFSDHMIPHYGDYTQSETYNDFFAVHSAEHLMQAHIERAGGWARTVAFRRPKVRGIYSKSDHERFTLLIPHLVSAARHSRLLSGQALVSQSLISALEKLHLAVLVLDSNDRVVFANGRAEKLLQDAEVIAVSNRRLVAARHDDNRRLRRMLASTRAVPEAGTKASPGHIVIKTSGDEETVFVSAMPLTRRVAEPFAGRPAVVVFVTTSRRLQGAEDIIGELYGLTRTEARVVVGLYDGLSIAEIAEMGRTSRDAVRFHLKNVFQKLGVHRQTGLVKLISSGPALLLMDRDEQP